MIDSHSVGRKTEPHLEIGAENYIRRCWARNISRFIEENKKYLFLLTVCKNKDPGANYFGKPFIVGFIEKQTVGQFDANDENRKFVKGATKLFEFKDSVSYSSLFREDYRGRSSILHNLWVDEEKTGKIINHFKSKEEIKPKEYIAEINRLDINEVTCKFKKECFYRNECLRFPK